MLKMSESGADSIFANGRLSCFIVRHDFPIRHQNNALAYGPERKGRASQDCSSKHFDLKIVA